MNLATRVGLVAVLVVLSACNQTKVNDFESWCSYTQNQQKGQIDVLSFDREPVRNAIVKKWDTILEQNAVDLLGPSKTGKPDSVVAELRRSKMLGAWRVGDTVHFGLSLFPSPIETPGVSVADGLAAAYSKNLSLAGSRRGVEEMDSGMYCLYAGLNLFFARVELHASDGNASITSDAFAKLQKYTGQ